MNKSAILNNKRKSLLSILSGTTVAIATTLILILLFALLIRFVNISENLIFPVNQVIKLISLIIGALFFLKKDNKQGFFKGILLGFCYYILSYLVFSFLQGNFTISVNNFYDLLLTTVAGGVIGVILVNLINR